MLNINLADFIDGNDQITRQKIQKCPDKDAFLEYSVKATRINDSGGDYMSEMGGLGDLDLDSNPDSEYNLKDFEKSQIYDVPMEKDLDDVGVPTD